MIEHHAPCEGAAVSRRRALAGMAAMALIVPAGCAHAADFPSRAVRIVPYGPGGSPIDLVARVYAEQLHRRWNQPVIVDPRPGASGIIAADAVAKAQPDGHTILITLPATHINALILQPKLPYDPVKDFTPLSKLATGSGPVLVAAASAPYSNIKELAAYAKSRPTATYGTWGNGTTGHLFGELLKRQAIPNLVHVPYKTEGTAHQDMFAGLIDAAWSNGGTAKAHIRAGKMKILAVPGTRRTRVLPDAATFSEQGLRDFDIDTWIGAYGPGNLPAAVRDEWTEALQAATRSLEVQNRLLDAGFEPLGSPAQEFAATYAADFPRIRELINAAGVTGTF